MAVVKRKKNRVKERRVDAAAGNPAIQIDLGLYCECRHAMRRS